MSDDRYRVILASASPARFATLSAAGIDVEVVVSGVDESAVDAADAATLSGTLARMKAQAVADALAVTRTAATAAPAPPATLVIGCDSVLEFDGAILGKPADAADAIARWHRMRGRSGVLHTGHCVIDAGTGKQAGATAATTVYFADISDAEIEAYVATGEPLHVAGAFTIDGLGGPFVSRLEGDAGTVVGLSLPTLRNLLADLGVPIVALWRPTRP
jgi:septum formation protein